MFRTVPRSALLLLVFALAACDYGDGDGLILDGTYRGSGQSQIATGTSPGFAQVDVTATFDEETVGALDADVVVTVTAFGSPSETYSATVDGTLTGAGALSLDGLLTQGSLEFLFRLEGNASANRIEGAMTGNLPVSNLVLTR
ncbi:MAG: hypothetical protein Rubg2KO_27030 [Rubricoccaceae bacterium]